MTVHEINTLLDIIERKPNHGPFVGRQVADAIRRAKYPYIWLPLIKRYVELLDQNSTTAKMSLYCDLACTIITKKVLMVDIFYLYRPTDSDAEESDTFEDLREAHMITATKYLICMLTCIYECLHGRLPNKVDITRAAKLLYAELYAEAFDVASVQERDIFRCVEKWFFANLFRSERVYSSVNVAPGIPFLFCSHVYWFWLHLTAARIQHESQELVTVIYALDMIVYCEDCKRHFIEFRNQLFVTTSDELTGQEIGIIAVYPENDEVLFHLHNKVNSETESPDMNVDVLSEYKDYWEM